MTSAVRRRVFLILEPPEYDEATGQAGVAPSTGRADLYWMGAGSGARSVKLHNTAENGQLFRTIPDTQYGPIRTGGRLKADTPK